MEEQTNQNSMEQLNEENDQIGIGIDGTNVDDVDENIEPLDKNLAMDGGLDEQNHEFVCSTRITSPNHSASLCEITSDYVFLNQLVSTANQIEGKGKDESKDKVAQKKIAKVKVFGVATAKGTRILRFQIDGHKTVAELVKDAFVRLKLEENHFDWTVCCTEDEEIMEADPNELVDAAIEYSLNLSPKSEHGIQNIVKNSISAEMTHSNGKNDGNVIAPIGNIAETLKGICPNQQQQHQLILNKNTPKIFRFVLADNGIPIQIGSLYDANTDNLLINNSMANPRIEFMQSDIICNKKPRMLQPIYRPIDKLSPSELGDRFHAINIDDEQKISTLLGLTNLEGFGEFFNVQKYSFPSECSFAICRIIPTKEISIEPSNLHVSNLNPNCGNEQMEMGMTHVVSGISFGLALVIVFCVSEEDCRQQSIDMARLKKIVHQKIRNCYVPPTDEAILSSLDSFVHCQQFTNHPHICFPERGAPLRMLDAIQLFTNLPNLATNFDGPLLCQLSSLNVLPQTELNGNSIEAIQNILTEFLNVQRKFQDFQQTIDGFSHCFSQENIHSSKMICDEFFGLKEAIICKFRELVLNYRKGKGGLQELDEIENISGHSFTQISELFLKMDTIMDGKMHKKMEIANFLQKNNVPYISHENGNQGLLECIRQFPTSFVFFHLPPSFAAKNEQKELYQENLALFKDLVTRGEHKCVFVDSELVSLDIPNVRHQLDMESTIMKFREQHPIVENHLKEEKRKQLICLAKIMDNSKIEQIFPTNGEEMLPVEICCPISISSKCGQCPDEEKQWECDECGAWLHFEKTKAHHTSLGTTGGSGILSSLANYFSKSMGINNNVLKASMSNALAIEGTVKTERKEDPVIKYFYCACGRTPVDQFAFRCNSGQHKNLPNVFTMFSNDHLRTTLNRLNTSGEKCILVMGETGIGKSTWINSLANYMFFERMEDAIEAANPICLIPTSFSLSCDDYQLSSVNVQFGEDDENEKKDNVHEVGKSKTKDPKPHPFIYRGQQLIVLDTPGIGDTEGVKKDRENFGKVLEMIGNIRELHGICILMRPNESRLSEPMQYYIGELLTHLHRNAANNIVFCFTHTRETFYRLGQTLQLLRFYLNELEKKHGVRIPLNSDTVYCMDNEGFCFLAASSQGIQFSENMRQNYAESWHISAKETQRMLSHIFDLKSHRTMETISLNDSRNTIIKLSEVLALQVQNIQSNIEALEDKKKELSTIDLNCINFNAKLLVPYIAIVENKLEYPRTVCVADKCTEVRKDKKGKNVIHYKSHCHPHCYLKGVKMNVYNNVALKECWAMSASGGQSCRVCNCGYNVHKHIEVDQTEEPSSFEDEHIVIMLKNNASRKDVLKTQINVLEQRVKQYEDERAIINKIASKFASFLKHNSILPYNDGLEGYLNLAIQLAKRIAEQSGDRRRLDALEKFLREYHEEKAIIDAAIAKGTEKIEAFDIKNFLEELFALKLNGEKIREMFNKQKERGNQGFNSLLGKPIRPIRRNSSSLKYRVSSALSNGAKFFFENFNEYSQH